MSFIHDHTQQLVGCVESTREASVLLRTDALDADQDNTGRASDRQGRTPVAVADIQSPAAARQIVLECDQRHDHEYRLPLNNSRDQEGQRLTYTCRQHCENVA